MLQMPFPLPGAGASDTVAAVRDTVAGPGRLARLVEILQLDAAMVARAGLRVATIWAFVWVAWRVVRLAAHRIEVAVDDGDPNTTTPEEKRGRTIAQLVRSVGRVVMLILGVLLTLDVFMDIGPLLAGAGILGLAISFGGQSLVKDVISGFFILIEGQMHVGDIVQLGDRAGTVERMTLRVVQLRDLEGTVHYIPNGEIRSVSNRTRGWSRAVLDFGVAYGERIDRVLEVVADEARRLEADGEWGPRLDGPPEVLGVQALEDSAVVVRMMLRTQAGQQWVVGREMRRRVKNRFDAEGISIPFPQRQVWLTVQGQASPPLEPPR